MDLSEPFYTMRGFRQGDALSHHLFNLFINSDQQKADDIDIIGRTKKDVTAAFSAIKRKSTKMGLAVNKVKTKYMLSTNRDVRHILNLRLR